MTRGSFGLKIWQERRDELTGQVPLEMMRSKARASGIPKAPIVLPEQTDSFSELGFTSPFSELRAEETWAGRR